MGWPRITLPRRQRQAGTGFYQQGADPYGDGLNVTEALARLAPDGAAPLTAPVFTARAVPLTRPQPMYVPGPAAARPAPPARQPSGQVARRTAPVPARRAAVRPLDRRIPRAVPGAVVHEPQHASPPALGVLRRTVRALGRKKVGEALDPTPVGDQAQADHQPAGRLPQVSERRATAAEARLARVAYPLPGGPYDDGFWQRINTITGTTGPRADLGPADEEGR